LGSRRSIELLCNILRNGDFIMNSFNATGRITSDLELKTSQSGISVCSFTLAVKRPKVKDTTDFINFTAFRQTAEYLTNYANKGALIEVQGVLTSRKWEDKNGNKRVSFEVIVDNASILDSKKAEGTDPLPQLAEKIKEEFTEVEEGDLPF
jgi:single-strand DNA-binding protein